MRYIFTSLILALVIGLQAKKTPNLPQGFAVKESKTTIAFTENKGQVYDQNYKARPDVLFGAMTGNMAFHLKTSGVSYQLYRVDKWKEVEDKKTNESRREIDQQTIYRIDLNWLNHNTNFTTTHDKTLLGYNNYYLESCPSGALNVKSYTGVTLNNLYNGINLHYYEKAGQLKHDYIVAPHANYKRIQLQVRGADIKINKDGTLLLTTPLGKVQEGAPIVFQNGKQLNASWVVKNSILSFDIENYNPNFELIIDPLTRLWGTYCGGSSTDYLESSTFDSSTNDVYLSGYTNTGSGTLIATTSGHQNTFGGGNWDGCLIKYNTNGVRQWGTFYGGSTFDYGRGCAVDANGNVFLTGYSDSNTGTVIATPGSHQNTSGGGYDAFLVKFNSSGVRQWGTYYGGIGYDEATSCSIDASGNLYMSGLTNTNTNTVIATTGSHQSSVTAGTFDAFLVKFNNNGIRQWGTYYGGNSSDYGYSTTTDGSGNVFMAGSTTSSFSISTLSSHQSVYSGASDDCFLVKFNSAGVRQWCTYYGGNGTDIGRTCATDAVGNIFLAGLAGTVGGTVIATTAAQQTVNGGGGDAFLAKFDANGVRQWATYYGGSGNDEGRNCYVDAIGNVYLTGETGTSTSTVITTSGAYQTVQGSPVDAFLVMFNTNGIRQWGTYYGGNGSDFGRSVLLDSQGSIFLSGYTFSNNGTTIATSGSQQSAFGGGTYDLFLVKFKDCALLSPTITLNSTICNGSSINFSVSFSSTVTPTYNWSGPNSFTASVQNPSISNAGSLNSGNYTLTLNNNGCIETKTSNVTVNANPTITVNSGSVCAGNSFTIIPNGASTYTIQGGSNIVSPSSNTSYTVSGTSAAGCISANTATSNVTVNSNPTITVNSGSICSGSNFTITPSGANTYTIQGGSNIVSPLSNTSYTIKGTSAQGCVSANTATSNVTVNATPTITVNSGAICAGSNFTITPSGASTYTVQGGSNIVSPSANTNYTVTGTSAQGCIGNIATSNVTVNANPTIAVNNGAICAGSSFTITPSGANTYTVQGGSNIVSPTSNTNYTISGTSSQGCIGNIATSNVTVNALPNVTVNSSTLCLGQTNLLIANGANTYSWSTAATTPSIFVTPTTNTNYIVTGTDANGCVKSATSTAIVNPNPTVTASSSNSIICTGQTAVINPNGAVNYSITGNSFTVSPSVTTNYTITGVDANGCTNTTAFTQSVSACTGFNNLATNSSNSLLLVYPNPSNGEFNINITQDNVIIEVLDILGKVILNENISSGTNKINLSENTNGLYFLRVSQNGQTQVIKLIKE
jgi:hypothetical protein